MEQHEVEAVAKRKRAILNRTTILEKGIKIPDLERFMWTYTKQNNDKDIERMEN
jgi:late competence protein required for DNA uptake (superfamily II DNA/RNA helicase)